MKADGEIVRLVLLGDRDAFAELVARHERAAWATARRIVGDDHIASDAVQEAFLQSFHRLSTLRNPAQFGVWLLKIARREAVRLARQRARQPACPVSDQGHELVGGNGTGPGLSADSEDLLKALGRLPDHERLVVSLRYLEGHSVSEIAQALDRPVGTVTKQLSRAIDRLRGTLKEVN
jgi:RNA polymerase sigma-70 factor, ECF subfamily